MKKDWNFKKELARKFVHFFSIFILIIYFFVSETFSRQIALFILVLILIIFLEFEYLRIEVGRKIPILSSIWKYVRREKEKDKLGGDVYLLLGAILVLSIFDIKIAIIALLMTTFGDMAAALIGTRFGKHYLKHLKDRAWEGILAELLVNLFIGFMVFFWGFWSNLGLISDVQSWTIIIVMSITATFVETIIYKMDDNLLIPVFSGFNGQMVLLLFNWLS